MTAVVERSNGTGESFQCTTGALPFWRVGRNPQTRDSLENAGRCARRKAGTATNSRLWNWLAVPGLPTGILRTRVQPHDRVDKTFDGVDLGLGGDLDAERARGLGGDGPDGGHRDAAQGFGSGGFHQIAHGGGTCKGDAIGAEIQ